jgi:hypothetical protein
MGWGIFCLIMAFLNLVNLGIGIKTGESFKEFLLDITLFLILLICGIKDLQEYAHRDEFKVIENVNEYKVQENLFIHGTDTTKTYNIEYLLNEKK